MTEPADYSLSVEAVDYILRRMRGDRKLSYFVGFGTQTFEMLTAAAAEAHSMGLEDLQRRVVEGSPCADLQGMIDACSRLIEQADRVAETTGDERLREAATNAYDAIQQEWLK